MEKDDATDGSKTSIQDSAHGEAEGASGPTKPTRQPSVPPAVAFLGLPSATVSSLSQFHFHQDIDRWKNLYEACRAKLEQLRVLQARVEEYAADAGAGAGLSDEACEARRCWEELRAEVEAATRTLSQEHSLVERALERHGAVLQRLLKRLQERGSGLQLQAVDSAAPSSHGAHGVPPAWAAAGTSQPRPPTTASASSSSYAAASAAAQPPVISKETLGALKELIREHEMLTASVEEAERVKNQEKNPYIKECQDVHAMRAAEEKLRRHNSLMQLQVMRLQYELSRLAQAQATEMDAVSKLLQQASSELRLTRAHEEQLAAVHSQLQDGTRSVVTASGCQELYRHASRNSFVGSLEDRQRQKERRDRLASRLHSERVYREVDHLDDQTALLRGLGEELTKEIESMNETERANENTWLALRQERDELTAHLYPDLQRLQELQEIAKEKLELETKLYKENFLFKKQLEDFQKDLLEVETDLLTGNINRRARATKNIVTQLIVLRDCITQQNAELWTELRAKRLTVSPSDSLASAAVGEEEFRQHITDKMKKMELRIKEDLDRRALFKPKKFVFEAPGAPRIPFRGQMNVIKVPSKVAADWRRKTTPEMHRQEAMQLQVEKLRREILNKLSLEKEKAKQQLLQYESRRHALGPPGAPAGAPPGAPGADDVKATQELRSILGQLDAFLHRARRSRGGEPSSSVLAQTAEEPELEGDFGREMHTLVLQLEKLQSALEGSSGRERERKATALERGRQLFSQLPDAENSRDREQPSESSSEQTNSPREL